MKKCSKCKEIKEYSEFSRNKSSKDGFQNQCKNCKNTYYQNKKEYYKSLNKKNYENNKENHLNICREWRLKNKEKKASINKCWRSRNQGKILAQASLRKRKIRQATPAWVNKKKIEEIYIESHRLSTLTGISFHVDHIIPLKGKLVSGLHVPWNLQIMPWYDNLSKGNKHKN